VPQNSTQDAQIGKRDLALVLSSLELGTAQIQEVFDAVSSSDGNGYDEEYTMKDLFENPGSGVGDRQVKSNPKHYELPIRDLFEAYYQNTKASSSMLPGFSLEQLKASDLQIYWPYSEDWDGITAPLITYDPGYGAESNYAYTMDMKDSVLVTEQLAKSRPVWVVNSNRDSGYTPLDFFKTTDVQTKATNRKLMLKSITMLRNYDSWFCGASEFNFQIGSVEGFRASTDAELALYYPTITNFQVIVKRKELNVEKPLDILMMTDFTNQLDKLAFLLTEDDGGTTTSWKCSAIVKVESKSYGFDVSLPYNDKDDIVWRGQLAASFFQEEDVVSARFGDVRLSFELL